MSQVSWDAYNELLLHGSLDRFTKMLARYELYKRIIDLPGDIVECGVFKGAGTLYWAKLTQIFNSLSLRRIVGFDTFEGYPTSTSHQYDQVSGAAFIKEAHFSGNPIDAIYTAARNSNIEHRVELVAGDATITIKDYVMRNPGFRIAMLYLDFDVYEPTIIALEALYPLVVPGGLVVFDEYAIRGWGESDAADQFFATRNVRYQTVPWALSPTAFIVKP